MAYDGHHTVVASNHSVRCNCCLVPIVCAYIPPPLTALLFVVEISNNLLHCTLQISEVDSSVDIQPKAMWCLHKPKVKKH